MTEARLIEALCKLRDVFIKEMSDCAGLSGSDDDEWSARSKAFHDAIGMLHAAYFNATTKDLAEGEDHD